MTTARDEVYLAFDLGASSGRAILGRVGQDGEVQLEEVHRFANGPVRGPDGIFWDIQGLFGQMCTGLAKVGQRGIQPRAIGVDTWGVDFALLDAQGKLLAQPRCYRDPRNAGLSRRIVQQVGADRLMGRTGSMFQDHASLCQLLAVKQNTPELLERAAGLLFIPDLLRNWLCGSTDSDCTIASTSQMYDVPRRQWSKDILQELGLPWELLPGVTVGPHVSGMLSEELCRKSGISPVPVVSGAGHDTGAAFGICRGGDLPAGDDLAVISSGTWSLLGVFVEGHLPAGTLDGERFGYEANPDGSLRITCNMTGGWLIERCRDVWTQAGQDVSYGTLIAQAQAASGTPKASAILDTQWEGFIHPENMCQAIVEHCIQSRQSVPETIGEFSQVVFASLAACYAGAIRDLRTRTGKPLGNLYVVGGMSRNAYLNELTGQQAGVKIIQGPSEATAMGNIAVQRAAIGRSS